MGADWAEESDTELTWPPGDATWPATSGPDGVALKARWLLANGGDLVGGKGTNGERVLR